MIEQSYKTCQNYEIVKGWWESESYHIIGWGRLREVYTDLWGRICWTARHKQESQWVHEAFAQKNEFFYACTTHLEANKEGHT